MKRSIYLDNNATTKVDIEVFNAMEPYFKEEFGNPSSTYGIGKEVKNAVDKARESVAKLLNADFNQIVFTSSGSESNVTAIMSAVDKYPEKRHIITTKVEHASIMETMRYLEKKGYKVTYVGVDSLGRINMDELKESIDEDTLLISVMYANNEIGNIYPVKEIAKIAHDNNILMHVDGVQAAGKIKIDVKDLDVDFLSISGHKINVPKGIGVLYVKDNNNLTPLVFGHQESNRRGGTENTAYIVGLGRASEMIINDNYSKEKEIEELRNYLEEEIKKDIDDIRIYGDLDNRTPNTSSIAFGGIKGDDLMFELEKEGIYVSTGSACNSAITLPSYVLTACKADVNNYSPIRISLGKYNTKEEIDEFINILKDIVKSMRN